jgi:tRNA pseudouridine55 synthase
MGRKRKGHKIDGWINVYKPAGMGSTDVVRALKRAFRPQKIGHAGTLDPLAYGVLPIALGEATKTIPYVQDHIKTYGFNLVMGEARNTDDAEGDITDTSDYRPSKDELLQAIPFFLGDIVQTPPKFSAVKIDGKRAYDLARAGKDVKIKPRNVFIKSLELQSYTEDSSQFICICGKGTYIRSIGRDLALKTNTYGHITDLERLSVGSFQSSSATPLEKILELQEEMGDSAALKEVLQPLHIVLDDIPALIVTEEDAAKLRQGQKLSGPFHFSGEHKDIAEVVLTFLDDQAIALVRIEDEEAKPLRVFNL